jgi:hypothetical protein
VTGGWFADYVAYAMAIPNQTTHYQTVLNLMLSQDAAARPVIAIPPRPLLEATSLEGQVPRLRPFLAVSVRHHRQWGAKLKW